MIKFTGERIVPGAKECEPNFALKMYQEHIARYLFASQFVKGKEVLDVGCGVGYGSLCLAKAGAKRVLAFDASLDAVNHAKSFYTHEAIEYKQLNAETFKLESKFDIIVCFELIEHVNNQEQTTKNIYNHLKEDGLLVISTPRRLGEKRSAFHSVELSFQGFDNLLNRYFKQRHYLFQNNHFISCVGNAFPGTDNSQIIREVLNDVFTPEKCDTFICMASNNELDVSKTANVLVANDESYVKLLERDVAILRGIESTLNSQVSKLETEQIDLQNTERTLRNDINNLEDTQAEAEAKLIEAHQIEEALRNDLNNLEDTLNNIYNSRGWKIIYDARNVIDRLAPFGTRRRKIAGWVFSEVWNLLHYIRGKSQIKSPAYYSKFKVLVSNTYKYYKKNGLRETISRIYIEITKKGRSGKAKSYIPQFYLTQTQLKKKTGVTKVSFLIGCLEGESKRYRVYNLIEGLTKRGIECRTFYEINEDKLDQVIDCDLLILFRAAMSPALENIIKKFNYKHIPVVFDVDDLIFEPDSIRYVDGIRNWSDGEKSDYLIGVNRYRQTLERCDYATCTTEFLANRIRAIGKQCYVIPNTINNDQYELTEKIYELIDKNTNKRIKIGYFSGTNTHNRDFLEAADAVQEILQKQKNTELHIIGALNLPQELSGFGNRVVRKQFMPHLEMLKYVSTVDICIAPLELNNPFTAGKSELKIFEPALLGIPSVVSRTDSYSKCIQDGRNGFLAGSKEEWLEKLSKLIENNELRITMGIQAKEDFTKAFYIENVIDNVITTYEKILENAREKDIDLDHLDIAWVIPEPFIGSGGHRSIFRAVRNLSKYGHKLTMYFQGDANEDTIKQMVNQHFYNLSQAKFIKYNGDMDYHDCCFATHWTTVYTMMRHKDKIKFPFYYVQDYEPMFSPMGTEYILAENTYKMGLTNITSGPWMSLKLKNKFNAEADYFRFPIDNNIYNLKIKRTKANKNIIFFSRPEMPRRCYDIGILALRLVKEKLPDVEIILFGSSKINSKAVPFEHTNLGLLPDLNSLAALYRNADFGIVFSTTNPSLVPYEMMACGLAVGDLRLEDSIVNYENEENVYLLNPIPEIMTQEIVGIMNNSEERHRKAENGYRFSQTFPDEEGMARRIEELIKRKVRGTG